MLELYEDLVCNAPRVCLDLHANRYLGGELRSRALPTFTNILHTLAPPISSHERLQIHITHDIVGYPSLDPLIYATFSRVMAQVEGGDLMVIQRGQESSPRRDSNAGYTGSNTSGWSDGPWWRQSAETRSLGAVKGLVEGTKLSKVSAESYANDYFASQGGLEEAAKQATEDLSESNPVRSSDIFLSIQAITHPSPSNLFGGPAQDANKNEGVVDPENFPENLLCFAIYLHDPIHGITFHTVTQTLPHKWVEWLDASPTSDFSESNLPEEIAEIVNTGGVDPREWVAEWVEELLTLGVGVVAQRYVARRMGVGQGGIGRGKARQQVLESGGGEAARAVWFLNAWLLSGVSFALWALLSRKRSCDILVFAYRSNTINYAVDQEWWLPMSRLHSKIRHVQYSWDMSMRAQWHVFEWEKVRWENLITALVCSIGV